jgi:hypothetical protein
MRKIKLLFDLVEYFLVRLFMLLLLIIGAIALLMQHWPLHR